jgi:RNA polymerase sigma factor (sigma-70 family)
MRDVSDVELLREYSRQDSEEAFAELVRRHIHLVYSVALRHVRIAAAAEEITQAVFVILARKAAGLRPATVLESWLYETTRLTSLSFLRGERRRQMREQEAYMQSTMQESSEVPIWNQLAPLLDEAMARLGKKDREAVILRFFKEKNLGDVAAALRLSESAAQSRVHRAVDKLRKFFIKRGLVLTTVAIAGAISANSVQAAPAALAKSVTAVALTKGATASGSTLILIKGALKLMAYAKAKTAVWMTAVAVLGTGTTLVTVEAVRAAHSGPAPEIQGAWQGVDSLGGPGVQSGEIHTGHFKARGLSAGTAAPGKRVCLPRQNGLARALESRIGFARGGTIGIRLWAIETISCESGHREAARRHLFSGTGLALDRVCGIGRSHACLRFSTATIQRPVGMETDERPVHREPQQRQADRPLAPGQHLGSGEL